MVYLLQEEGKTILKNLSLTLGNRLKNLEYVLKIRPGKEIDTLLEKREIAFTEREKILTRPSRKK